MFEPATIGSGSRRSFGSPSPQGLEFRLHWTANWVPWQAPKEQLGVESKGHVSWRRFLGSIAATLSLASSCMSGAAPAAAVAAEDSSGSPSVERAVPHSRGSDIVLDEIAQQTAPILAFEPSHWFVEAQRAHDAGNYLEAASNWESVTQGNTLDDSEHRAIAEYQVGVALVRLGVTYASINQFREAAEHRSHPMHLPALAQLARIAEGLPELWITLPLFSAYSLAEVERLHDLPAGEKTNLVHLLGRGLYENRDYAQAQEAFARVGLSSPHFLEARLFESACHVRQHHSVPALTSLKRGIAALEHGDVRVRDRQRWIDLLNLSQARIYYSTAIALDAETNIPTISQARISAAVKYYNLLGPESEYYLEATFELAWAHFTVGQYPFAFGKIFTLDAPYYRGDFHPEAQVLKAVVYNANCNYEAATITTARFNKRYIPIRDELKKLLRHVKQDEPGRLVRILDELRRHLSVLRPTLEPIVSAAYRERGFLRMLRTTEAIEVEAAKLEVLFANPKSSAIGVRLRQELDLHRQAAASRADQWLRAFLQRRVDEIDEHVRNIEPRFLLSASRDLLDPKLKSGQVSKAESIAWGSVRGDEEHVIWPFDGEYWLDEIGTYRVTVLSSCGR
jgi:hypothetical protein